MGPAHTAGDVLVEVPDAAVVFTGDILFDGGHPIVWAGPVANWVAACERILAMDVDTVVPGHGPSPTRRRSTTPEEPTSKTHKRGAPSLRRRDDPDGSGPRGIHPRAWPTGGASPNASSSTSPTLYRDFGGDPPSDIFTLFTGMAELAGYS